MSIGRIALCVSAAGWGFGAAFLVWPVELVGLAGIELPSATARADVRAVYGGLQLGLAAFVAYCAARPERTVVGLVATTSCIVGLLTGRLVGALVDGECSRITLAYLSIEAVSAAVAAAALWWEARARRTQRGDRWAPGAPNGVT
jgi:hypothetical protein